MVGMMRCLICMWLSVVVAGSAWGARPEHWRPVDQAVEDLDVLSTGLRRVEPGLRDVGEQTRLYRVDAGDAAGGAATYYRVGPGVRARVHRVEYLIPVSRRTYRRNITPVRDGAFRERAAENTVYDLRPVRGASPMPDDGDAGEARIDGRVDGRVEGRIDGRVE